MPNRVEKYHAQAPTAGQDVYLHQVIEGRRFYNALVAIERRRRFAYEWARLLYGGPLAEAKEALEAARGALKAARDGVKAQRANGRTRKAQGGYDIAALIAAQAQAQARYDEAKAIAKEKGLAKEAQHMIAGLAKEARKAARQEAASRGLHWGTYNAVIDRVEQAAETCVDPEGPEFRRRDGGGSDTIGVQIQCSTADREAGKIVLWRDGFCHGQAQIELTPLPVEGRRLAGSRRAGQRRGILRLRVGSEEGRGSAKMVVIPILVHRPPPPGARIVGIEYTRRSQGTDLHAEAHENNRRWRYSVAITYAAPAKEHAPRSTRSVAVNLGWRGGRRVGFWADSEGQSGEIAVPDIEGMSERADHLEGIRDSMLTVQLGALSKWLAAQADQGWMADIARWVPQWKSQRRLALLVKRWQSERLPGDDEILGQLTRWTKQDAHLEREACGLRARLDGRRRDNPGDGYRAVAARMAREYTHLIVAKRYVAKLTRKPKPEKGAETEGKEQRKAARRAAPGKLRDALTNAFGREGGVIVEVDSVAGEDVKAGHTQTCSWCGHVNNFDAAKYVMHTCTGCGRLWDQDHNAARNHLRASGVVIDG